MRWPHYEHVFFDCDSTLTAVEGIDVLAESVGKGRRVEILTQAAMDGQLDLSEVYDKRLRAVRPTQQQVFDIRRSYKRHIVEDAARVITASRGTYRNSAAGSTKRWMSHADAVRSMRSRSRVIHFTISSRQMLLSN